MAAKPPVLILSGFLGSGKTTLLMRLVEYLSHRYGEEYKIAIIENEIGDVSIDSSVIQQSGYAVTELTSGCICCTLVGQLIPAVNKLVDELQPSLIVIETTGVATPETIANNLHAYAGCDVRIVSLVDASRWQRIHIPLQNLLEAQIEPANVVCINKTDLVDEAQLEAVCDDVKAMNPQASLVPLSAERTLDDDVMALILGENHE